MENIDQEIYQELLSRLPELSSGDLLRLTEIETEKKRIIQDSERKIKRDFENAQKEIIIELIKAGYETDIDTPLLKGI